jgi:hypothetical protein
MTQIGTARGALFPLGSRQDGRSTCSRSSRVTGASSRTACSRRPCTMRRDPRSACEDAVRARPLARRRPRVGRADSVAR